MERNLIMKNHIILSIIAAALAGLAGCGDGSRTEAVDSGADAGTDTDTDADAGSGSGSDAGEGDPLDAFFSPEKVHAIEITLDAASIAALVVEPKVYVHGAIRIDGATYEDVGVRLKGAAGSFVAIDSSDPVGNGAPGKSGFIVKFDEYVQDQEHVGLSKLTLNNNVQDTSRIRQVVGYALFRELGLPASRAGFAEVRVNGESKGVYTLVEPTDGHAFLDRSFGGHDGNLYEGEYGSDFETGVVDTFDQDNGEDTTRADLSELVAALDAIGEGGDTLPVLEARFDLDEYLAFAAAELYLGHWDGYAWYANNFLVHHDLASGAWSFIPWGIDQTFSDVLSPYGGVMQAVGPAWGGAWGAPGGRVHRLCFESPACLARLEEAFDRVLDVADAMDLRGRAEAAWAAVGDAALAESSLWGDPDAAIYASADVSAFIVGRRAEIETWLPCLSGGALDVDGDGYDGCTADCDDAASSVFPSAEESCNEIDDDCNGEIDDAPECPQCIDEIAPDGRSYSLCSYPLSWEDAESFCEKRDARLAAIHDADTAELLVADMSADLLMTESWLGLSDAETEGAFAWEDGSAVDFDAWAEGEPGDGGEYTDCALGSAEGWVDAPCGDPHGFFCEYVPACDAEGEVWDAATGACAPWACEVEALGEFTGAPISSSGDTCVGTSIFADGDSGCTGWGAAEREILFSLVLPAGAEIEIAMAPTDEELDASLYLLSACDDFDRSECLVGADASYGGGSEVVTYSNDTGAELVVYIAADAYGGCGTFDLSIM